WDRSFLSANSADHGAVDLLEGVSAAHGHGVLQLSLELVDIDLYAFRATAVNHVDEGAGDEHAVGAQSQGLEHVHTSADTAIHQNGHFGAHCLHDLRQHLGGAGALVQHPA